MSPPRPAASRPSLLSRSPPRPRCTAGPGVVCHFTTQLQTPALAGPLVGHFEHLYVTNAPLSRRRLRNQVHPIAETGGVGTISNPASITHSPLGERAGQPPR